MGAGAGGALGIVGLHGAGADLRVVARDGEIVTCDAAALAAYLRAPAEGEARAGDRSDRRAGRPRRGAKARPSSDALLRASLGGRARGRGRAPAAGAAVDVGGAARRPASGRRAAAAVAGYLAQLALVAGLWWTVGARAVAARRGRRIDRDASRRSSRRWWACGWLSSWTAGRLAIDGGSVLRERLLHGLLALDTESTRADGIGQLLGRVVETEALESLALGGGLMAAAGAFELVTGAVILALGVAAGRQLPLLAAWCAAAALCWRRGFSARSRAGPASASR